MAITFSVLEVDTSARTVLVDWCDGKKILNHPLPEDLTTVTTEEGMRAHIMRHVPYDLVRPPVDPAVEQEVLSAAEALQGRTFLWRDTNNE